MAMARKRCFIGACKIAVCCALAFAPFNVARSADSEVELLMGPVGTSVADVVHGGFGIGAGLSWHPLRFSGGYLETRVALMPVFGNSPDSPIDVTQIQLPLTIALAWQEKPTAMSGAGIGGSIGIGLQTTVGRYTEKGADFQPVVAIDLTFGVFERGALKFRYSATIGNVTAADGSRVSYQSVMIIGSTAW